MKELRLHYPLPFLERILDVSASGYYAWVDRPLSNRDREAIRLELEIRAADKRTRHTYGAERLKYELESHGIRIGICRIRRIRKKLGIRCLQMRKFKATTDSNHHLPVSPNLLDRKFRVSVPDTAWVSDITYIPTDEGWLYLAGHKDLFSGEIVGYAMGERLTRDLVGRSLFRALSTRRPGYGIIHHSDRGSQYCSCEYREMLSRYGMLASMSATGNCFDNAPIRSSCS